MIYWDWVPRERVGPFRFGCPAGITIKQFGLFMIEKDIPSAYWETYAIPGYESRIMVEESRITGVLCCDELLYKSNNLIGFPFQWMPAELGLGYSFEPNVGLGCAIHYDCMGATFWIVDNLVQSVTCEGRENGDAVSDRENNT